MAKERLAKFRQALRPAALRPGVGGGVSLLLASVGSRVWAAADFDAVDEHAMTVVVDDVWQLGHELVLRCSGAEVGDVAFRMVVEAVTKLEDPGRGLRQGFRLRLRPVALSRMNDADVRM